jgi:hypothetical protein
VIEGESETIAAALEITEATEAALEITEATEVA